MSPTPTKPAALATAHPVARLARRQAIIAAVLFLCAAFAISSAAWPFAVITGLLSGFFAWVARLNFRSGDAVQLNNTAFDCVTRGRVDEAEALLAQIPATAQRGSTARAMALQRAMIALHRGEAVDAIAHATRAIERPKFFFTRDYEETQVAAALALRAVAQASLGNADGARADAARAEADDATSPTGLARVALARAIVLARSNEIDALGAHLGRAAGRALEWLTPRERALLRALRRMARARPKSVYRESARRDETTEEDRVVNWIAKLAPGAAAFAGEARHVEATDAPPLAGATAEAMQSVERSRAQNKKSSTKSMRARVLALWVLLVIMFLAIWQFLSPSDRDARVPEVPVAPTIPYEMFTWTVPAFLLLLLVGIIAIQSRAARRTARRVLRAQRAAASNDDARAMTEIESITKTRFPVVAAGAHLALAQLLERKASWPAVIAACDAGIARATSTPTVRAMCVDLTIPQLVETRAIALGATGRYAEADAELALLSRDFPTFAYAARAKFRVRMVATAHAGDLAAATEIARSRTLDLPLTLRDDILADVALAVGGGTSEEEGERIEAELRDDAELRAWIDAVAPGLRARLRGVRGPRVPNEATSAEQAHDEAAAELEAEGSPARPKRATVS